MAIRRQDLEQETRRIISDKTWKGHLTLGIILLVVGAIISSPLFMLLRDLLEAVLFLGGLFLVGWAIYQYVQLKEKK